jgi:RNA-directed DNA polymerase
MYNNIISIENLLEAWKEFLRGKKNKKDVQEFQRNLMSNIIALHQELKNRTYKHGSYKHFKISDPKSRDIHKATVKDRLVHYAMYRILYPYFDTKFIHDSYSCRLGKGTHRANNRLRDFARKVSKNNTKQCWVLKCDIKKFFASINHDILYKILDKSIKHKNVNWLIKQIVSSFNSGKFGVGLPLGNLTSQLLVNIYMNEFDQFVKHVLRQKHYIRYADDFIFLAHSKRELKLIIPSIHYFLDLNLKLSIHPKKIFIKTLSSGLDYLGWIHFNKHRILRTSTKKRMFKRLRQNNYKTESLNSYFGLMMHGNTFNIKSNIQKTTLIFYTNNAQKRYL